MAEEVLRLASSDFTGAHAQLLRLIHLSSDVEHRLFRLAARASGIEAARADEHERADAAERQAAAATDRLIRLRRVTSALCATVTAGDVADVVLAEALAASGAFGGCLAVISEDGTEFITVRQSGIQSHLAEKFVRFPISTPCMARDVLEVGALFMNFEEYLACYRTVDVWRIPPWTGARGAVRLQTQRGPIGALTFIFENDHDFSPEERAFFIVLADQCALALERAGFAR